MSTLRKPPATALCRSEANLAPKDIEYLENNVKKNEESFKQWLALKGDEFRVKRDRPAREAEEHKKFIQKQSVFKEAEAKHVHDWSVRKSLQDTLEGLKKSEADAQWKVKVMMHREEDQSDAKRQRETGFDGAVRKEGGEIHLYPKRPAFHPPSPGTKSLSAPGSFLPPIKTR